MTFPAFINFTGGQWSTSGSNPYRYYKASSSSASVQYELERAPLSSQYPEQFTDYGLRFVHESNGDTKIYVNQNDDLLDPKYITKSSSGLNAPETLVITSSDVGDTIYCYRSNQTDNNAQFVITSDMIFGSGSGAGTLSVVPTEFTTSVPSGVTPFDDAGPELYFTIAKTEASGQYNIYMDDVYYATATHTNGSVSSSQVPGRSFALNAKMYFGQVFSSSSLNTLVTEFTWPARKKVHSNFW